MPKEYKVGDRYYLPVTVKSICPGYTYPIELRFIDSNLDDTDDTTSVADEPDVLLTAEDIATVINAERDEALAELKARNAELEALLKEVTATRDEAIRQNDELITENKKLKAENGAWQIAAQTCADNAKVADKATEELRKENKELKAKAAENADTISRLSANKVALTEEVGKLRETIADRTKDVQHYKEENDRLKKALEERAENVMNLLEENDKLKAGLDVRYNDVLAMKKDRDTLLAENEKLKAERDDLASQLGKNLAEIQNLSSEVHFLKAQKEVKKPVHVFTNDGTEVEFRRYTSVTYRTDYNILVIKDGEEIVAGFIRGDRPGNLAYWWTE